MKTKQSAPSTEEIRQGFASRLAQAMEMHGYFKRGSGKRTDEFAKNVGITRGHVHKILRQECTPNLETAVRIADELGVSLLWLTLGKQSMAQENDINEKQKEIILKIIEKSFPLSKKIKDINDYIFIFEKILDDLSKIKTDHESLLKIIDISLSSAVMTSNSLSLKNEEP